MKAVRSAGQEVEQREERGLGNGVGVEKLEKERGRRVRWRRELVPGTLRVCERVQQRARMAWEHRKLRRHTQIHSCATIVKKTDNALRHHQLVHIYDIVQLHHVGSEVSLTSSAVHF